MRSDRSVQWCFDSQSPPTPRFGCVAHRKPLHEWMDGTVLRPQCANRRGFCAALKHGCNLLKQHIMHSTSRCAEQNGAATPLRYHETIPLRIERLRCEYINNRMLLLFRPVAGGWMSNAVGLFVRLEIVL